MQRGANGLTVDDGNTLDKKRDCALLDKAPRPPPHPQCHLLRVRNPLSALPLCWGAPGLCTSELWSLPGVWSVNHKEKSQKNVVMLLAYYPDYCVEVVSIIITHFSSLFLR